MDHTNKLDILMATMRKKLNGEQLKLCTLLDAIVACMEKVKTLENEGSQKRRLVVSSVLAYAKIYGSTFLLDSCTVGNYIETALVLLATPVPKKCWACRS